MAATELEIIYEDNHLLALAKPSGVPVVPDRTGDVSLLDLGKEHIRRSKGKRGNVFLAVVHRIDRPVSGVVCFARTSKAASRLSAQMRARQVEKVYVAVVQGAPEGEAGRISLPLRKDRRRNLVTVDGGPAGKEAHTCWELLARRSCSSLLLLRPETGRPHQLRCHCAAMGLPILGDVKYGARRDEALSGRIALHALALVVAHPVARLPLALVSPLPAGYPWEGFSPWICPGA